MYEDDLIVDLSHAITDGMPVYPNDDATTIKCKRTLARDGYNWNYLQTGLHAGTHIDMPAHFLDNAYTVEDYSVGAFIGHGVVLDVRGEKIIDIKDEYRFLIHAADIVLLYTGYDEFFYEPQYFRDYPVISPRLADLFVEACVKGVGMDTPAPDKFPFNEHKKLLSNDIFIIENMTGLSALKSKVFEVFCVPLKIAAAEASPVRAFARICIWESKMFS